MLERLRYAKPAMFCFDRSALRRHSFRACLAFALMFVGFQFPAFASETVSVSKNLEPGTILVRTQQRKLYYVVSRGAALRYTVGVGRAGKQWFGTTRIVTKALSPAWTPPAAIRGNRPAWVIPSGSPQNPMGAAALVLADSELAIHGTNTPSSIGGFVSWGCIRMHNNDIMDLYSRVDVGMPVVIAH